MTSAEVAESLRAFDNLMVLEERRPGLARLTARVLREKPRLLPSAALIEAKARYSNQLIVKRVAGRLVMVDNPDYLAARDRD